MTRKGCESGQCLTRDRGIAGRLDAECFVPEGTSSSPGMDSERIMQFLEWLTVTYEQNAMELPRVHGP